MTNPMFVIRYSNRCMYGFNSSKRITLRDIFEAANSGRTVLVKDKDSGDDITKQTMAKALIKYAPEQIEFKVTG